METVFPIVQMNHSDIMKSFRYCLNNKDSIDEMGIPVSTKVEMSSTNCFITPVLCHKRNGCKLCGIQDRIDGSWPNISYICKS